MADEVKSTTSDPALADLPTQEARASSHLGLVKTLLLFVVFMGIFHIILWLFAPENDPLQVAITWIVVRLVNACGIGAVATSTEIVMRNAHWIVAPECTAINVHVLFVSFILAYTASIRSKLLAIALGPPFIFVANIGRLVSLAWITDQYPQYATWFHNYIWQGAFLLMVVLLWMGWIEVMVNRERKAHISF